MPLSASGSQKVAGRSRLVTRCKSPMKNRKAVDLKGRSQVKPNFAVEMVNAETAAAMVGVSPRSWWRFVSAGKAPRPVRLGACVRWRLSDLRKWIGEGCQVVADPEGGDS